MGFLADAQKACLALGNKCSGVYDSGCNDKDEYYACTTATWATSTVSCIYTPPKPATTPKPTTPKPTTPKPLPQWNKVIKKHCLNSKHAKKYQFLADAQKACLGLGNKCSGVYDSSCDDKGTFYACTTAKWSTSSSSCIYTPPKPTTPKPLPQWNKV